MYYANYVYNYKYNTVFRIALCTVTSLSRKSIFSRYSKSITYGDKREKPLSALTLHMVIITDP